MLATLFPTPSSTRNPSKARTRTGASIPPGSPRAAGARSSISVPKTTTVQNALVEVAKPRISPKPNSSAEITLGIVTGLVLIGLGISFYYAYTSAIEIAGIADFAGAWERFVQRLLHPFGTFDHILDPRP